MNRENLVVSDVEDDADNCQSLKHQRIENKTKDKPDDCPPKDNILTAQKTINKSCEDEKPEFIVKKKPTDGSDPQLPIPGFTSSSSSSTIVSSPCNISVLHQSDCNEMKSISNDKSKLINDCVINDTKGVREFLETEKDLVHVIEGIIVARNKLIFMSTRQGKVLQRSISSKAFETASKGHLVELQKFQIHRKQLSESSVYLLWIPFAAIVSFVLVVASLAPLRFSDPLDQASYQYLDFASICLVLWGILLSTALMSLTNELLINKRLRCMEFPSTIPHLYLRFFIGGCFTIFIVFTSWYALYKITSTLVPFHAAICFVTAITCQGLYLRYAIIPTVFYKYKSNSSSLSKDTVFYGTVGIALLGFVVPMLIYWLLLIAFRWASTNGNLGLKIVILFLFQAARIFLMELETTVFHKILGSQMDGVASVLGMSVIGVQHYSFFSIVVENSSDITAMVFDVSLNFVLHIYTIVVMMGFTPHWSGRLWRESIYHSTCGLFLPEQELRSVEDEVLLMAKDRLILLMRFISSDVYKILMPIIYLAILWTVSNMPNAMWITGLGCAIWQHTELLTNFQIRQSYSIQILVMTAINVLMFAVVVIVLKRLAIDVPGALTVCCKEYGVCLFCLIVLMVYTQVIVIMVHSGMDFTMHFNWLSSDNGDRNSQYFARTCYLNSIMNSNHSKTIH